MSIALSSVLITPELISIPVPPLKCALTSEALGPVYVISPELYVRLPSPPESVTLIRPVISALLGLYM